MFTLVVLALLLLVLLEGVLVVWVGKAVGHRDQISRLKRKARGRVVGLPAVGESPAIRRRAG